MQKNSGTYLVFLQLPVRMRRKRARGVEIVDNPFNGVCLSDRAKLQMTLFR